MLLKRSFIIIDFIEKDVANISLVYRHIKTVTANLLPKRTFCISDDLAYKLLDMNRGNLKINGNDVHNESF